MPREVLHLAIPQFAVAVARAADSTLEGRPLAVAPPSGARSLVQCVSAEARREGVREGMSTFHARHLCPELTLLPPSPHLAFRAMEALERIASTCSPLIEPCGQGRLYIDLSGSRRLLGPGTAVGARLSQEILRQTGLGASVGLAANKLVARIASNCLESPGICAVLAGCEDAFIAPLPAAVLPGVGLARQTLLHELGLLRVGQIARTPLAQLSLAFGAFAATLRQKARGLDSDPVRPPRRLPQITEDLLLECAENDDRRVLTQLYGLSERCGLRLRRLGQHCGHLDLRLTYADGITARQSCAVEPPTNNDRLLFEQAQALYTRLCRRRLQIRSLTLSCALCGKNAQMNLFAAPGESRETRALQAALDRLREKHGDQTLNWGRGLLS